MLRLNDLSPISRGKLLARIAALGLNPVQWLDFGELGYDRLRRREPPNSFHNEGVGWCAGTLLYREDAELHGLAHEVGHLAQLDPEEWRALAVSEINSDEDVALVFQVELARGIPGLGVRRMLQEMVDADYSLSGLGNEGFTAVSTAYWWRVVVPREFRHAQQLVLRIAARWRGAGRSHKNVSTVRR